ncbi:MAG: ABC transporter ATP-binding protein [Coprobacillaceae bacterium]
MKKTILKIDGLSKKYGKQIAVDQLSLEIKEGEIFGLLGPNGAGKSTTMNMICSIIKPTFGDIEIFGLNTKNHMKEIKKQIGYIPQDLAIHGDLKAWENVELFTALYGIKGQQLKDAINDSLAFVGLSDKRNTFTKTFSGGMKRRLNIACAIGHQPKLLIFDEPTVGIDPQSRNFILNKIKEIKEQGTTVIYTSHYMEEIEAICSKIAIMDEGQIIAIGTKDELVQMVSKEHTEDMSLEEVFLLLTGKSLRDQY